MARVVLCLTGIVTGFLTLSPMAFGDELIELKAQVQHVQQENQALRELTERLMKRLEALERSDRLTQDVRGLQEQPADPVLAQRPQSHDLIEASKLNLRGFADVGFTTRLNDAENSNTFALGSVDWYMTSELTDRVMALVEADFASSTDTNAATFRLQRAHLKYALSDLWNITVGRMHTPLGYWNQTYHHGSWLQTSITRPEIHLFEGDDGGFLPVHSVGLELSGAHEIQVGDVGYNLGLYNGRGRTVTEVQNVKDKNDSKALNVLLSLKPQALKGLEVGGNVYLDEIPGSPPTASRLQSIDERIIGGYVTYVMDRLELLGELFHIVHDDKTSGREFESLGCYLQGGYRIESTTPYYRLDVMDVANGDPFFTTPRNRDRLKHTWGLRWEPFSWNAVKLEYSLTDIKQHDDEHAVALNSSFAF